MSRILLLILLALWMSRSADPSSAHWRLMNPSAGVSIFLGGYALLVIGMALWSRRLLSRSVYGDMHRRLDRFHQILNIARYAIVVWMGLGIYGGLGWVETVDAMLGPVGRFPNPAMPLALPAVIVGTLPGLLAWMGLWWAQFPADRAMREQHMLVRLNDDLPVHPPPGFRQFFSSNLRLQVLFVLAPALLLVASHDLVELAMAAIGKREPSGLEDLVMLPAAALMFIFAPEVLRRVAHSTPMPAGPLRDRLEAMCRAAGMGYRNILLWKTQHTMSNAFVMGLFPRVRYILLSDLLLETMTDEQIEAVFAHELGHVVHRHLWWLLTVTLIVSGVLAGPVELLRRWVSLDAAYGWIESLGQVALAAGGMLALLCWLSHRLERQADVYAARTMQARQRVPLEVVSIGAVADGDAAWSAARPAPAVQSLPDHPTYVGEYGAGLFSSALRRVADVNNIPLHGRDLLHPSIARRMRYLQEMSADPMHTGAFDRVMGRMFKWLLAMLLMFGAWGVIQQSCWPEAPAAATTVIGAAPATAVSPARP